ncbi:MAG: Na+/H+ antiporter subunit D [Puniceicoccaceae bacterium]|nr:MAG: Na+/H+ antiporter subunit D [Puniceicoccaceae bacterium]
MNEYSLLLPVFLPLIGAICLLLGRSSLTFQRVGGVVVTCATFGCSLYLVYLVDQVEYIVVQPGNWQAPIGISLVADRFSAIMVAIASFMGAAVAIYALGEIDTGRLRKFFFPIYLILIFGVNGAFLTGDLFNLYVWFEIMLIASFVLISMGGEKGELEGGLKYVCLNLLSSMLFLGGAGIIYGLTGTLNFADIAVKLQEAEDPTLVISASMLLLASFGLKAGIFPFFFWLPAAYHTPPPAITAIFAGTLTKVGVYVLFRCYTLMFVPIFPDVQGLILCLAILTMVTGVLGAASHFDMRRILSFHIISQIGYMLLGLALMTPLGIAAGIFYLIHNNLAKTNLFLVSGVVIRLKGTCDLAKVGGLCKSAPWLAFLFFIPAFSLGGIPPLSGFWAKFAVVKAGMEIESWIAVTAALLVGVMTLFSMTKIWAEAFWKKQPESYDARPLANPVGKLAYMVIPIAILAFCTVLMGIFGEPLFNYTERAAAQLLNPQDYISAVLQPNGASLP